MEYAAAFAVEIGKCTIRPLLRQIGYIVHYKRKLKKLERKIEDLQNTREDVHNRVVAAKRNIESIHKDVTTWLRKVDMEICTWNKTTMVLRNNEELYSCCTRYTVGSQAHKKIAIIDELLNQEKNFSDVSYHSLSSHVIEFIPTNKDFEDFASRESTKKQIMEALEHEGTYLIGLYGMGGVGKTMLMNQIGKQVKEEKLFDVVVMTTISQTMDMKGIQGQIAKRMGLNRLDQEDDICTRAMILFERLNQEQRILIILDDLWSTDLDLCNLGIPLGENHQKGCCKVVITTRSLDVCNSMMTQYNIKLDVLSREDSWHLFRTNVGEVMESSHVLQKTASELVTECRGLPIALVTLGRAMRNKDIRVWDDTVIQLKSSKFDLIEGMNSKVYLPIKLSYDYLGNEIMQKCFLFCCLFPEDHWITMDELMMYVMGDEQLLEDVKTLNQARGRLHTVMDKLIASCLLLGYINRDSNEYCVWMHDIVRDVAISIASSKQEGNAGFFVNAGVGLKHWPEMERLVSTHKCKHISLMRNEICVLPLQSELPQLLTLSLEGNKSLEEIHHRFFGSMKNLKTLNLRRIGISSLPSSLACLENLRVLHLDDRRFQLSDIDISVIGKLKMLLILSLQNCGLKRLPEQIGGLINLRSLNLSENPQLCSIPPNVILNMSRLEELYIWDSFHNWEIEGMGNGSNANLAEVASLTNSLSVIHLNVEHSCIYFEVSFGRGRITKSENLGCSCSYFECTLRGASFPFCHAITVLLETVKSLKLKNCPRLRSMGEVFSGGNNTLESLCVTSCDEMEYLMMSIAEDGRLPRTLVSLKEIHLRSLDSLRKIFYGQQTIEFIQNLKTLRVEGCNSLVSIFSSSMLNWSFQNLEVLNVDDCDALKDVFQVEEEGFIALPSLVLPRLREVKIRNCESLKHIFPEMRLLHGGLPQLEILVVEECHYLEEIFNVDDNGEQDQIIVPQLWRMRFVDLPRLVTMWKGSITTGSFPNLQEFSVGRCHNMKHIFPSIGLVRGDGGLSKLQELYIGNCKSVEEIFNVGRDEDEFVYDDTLLPQLRKVELHCLPKLKTIARGFIPSRSLEELEIDLCDDIKYIFPVRLLRHCGLMNLELLSISRCDNIEMIIKGEDDADKDHDIKRQPVLLPRLKMLHLECLEKLSLESSILDLPSLDELNVTSCWELKRLPITHQNAMTLRKLRGEQEWFDKLEWEDESIKSHLQSIFQAEEEEF